MSWSRKYKLGKFWEPHNKGSERYKTKLLEPLNKEKEITQQQESEKDDIFEVITATRVTKAKE